MTQAATAEPPPTMAVRFTGTGVPFWSSWIEGATAQVVMLRPQASAYLIRIPVTDPASRALALRRRGQPTRVQLAQGERTVDLAGVVHEQGAGYCVVACPITSLAQPRLVP